MLTKDFYTQVFPGRPFDPGQPYSHVCAPPPPPYVPPGGGGASGGGGCQVIPIYGSCAGAGGGPSESGGGQCIIGYNQTCTGGGGGSSGGGGTSINPPSPPPPPPQTPTPVDAPKLAYAPRTLVTSIQNYADSYTKYIYFPGTSTNMRGSGSKFTADANYQYFYYLLPKASIQAAIAAGTVMVFSAAIDTNQQGGQAPTATLYSPGNAPAGSLGLLSMNPLSPSDTTPRTSYSLYINNFGVPTMGAPAWPPPYPQGGVVDTSNAGACGILPLYWPRSNGSTADFDFSALGSSYLSSQSPPNVEYAASRQVFLSNPNNGQPLIPGDRDYIIAICLTGFLGAKFMRLKCGFTGG